MSTATINTIRDVLAGLLEPDQPKALTEVLAGDAAAARDGFPICIVAPDATSVADLRDAVPDALALSPFNEVVEWTADDCLLLERAGVLVAGTTARQLLPRTLVDAMIVAAKAGTPIALLVAGMGRTGDPRAASAGAGKQFEAVLPKARKLHVCLGESRYPGPSLTEAVAGALALRGPQGKTRALAALRAEQVRSVLVDRVDQVRSKSDQIGEHTSLLRQKERAGKILARAAAAAWHQHLAPLREALSTIDPDGIVGEVRVDKRGVAMVQRALELLRERASESLEHAVSESEQLMLAEVDQLAKTLGDDVERAREALASLGNPVEPGAVELGDVRDNLHARLNVVVAEALAELDVPSDLLSLVNWFQQRDDQSEYGTGEESDLGKDKDTDGKSHEESEAGEHAPGYDSTERRAVDRLRDLLAPLPEHIIAGRLRVALEEALSEADVRAGLAIDAAVLAWKELLPASVERSYVSLHDAAGRTRRAVSSRLDALLAALRALDLIGGASGRTSD